MYKFQKVKLNYNNIEITYDWMLVIDSIDDLLTYHKDVMSSQIPNAWKNLIEVQEGTAHINSNLARIINFQVPNFETETNHHNKSLLELTVIAIDKIFNAKADCLLNFGKIYINKNGGFFPHSKDITVLDEMIINDDRMIFPQYSEKDIRIKQWEGGKHYYAYVGDFPVELHGENKWNTEKRAQEMAEAFLYKLRNKQFEIK